MLAMWLIPFLCLVCIGAALLVGARRNRTRRALDGDLRDLLRENRVDDLRRRLDDAPAAVRAIRSAGGLFAFSNCIVLDLGEEQIHLRCFWPPSAPIDSVHRVWFTHAVGWVVETDGAAGPSRLYAWTLDVIPAARVAASRG
jgi:hypothetical protein